MACQSYRMGGWARRTALRWRPARLLSALRTSLSKKRARHGSTPLIQLSQICLKKKSGYAAGQLSSVTATTSVVAFKSRLQFHTRQSLVTACLNIHTKKGTRTLLSLYLLIDFWVLDTYNWKKKSCSQNFGSWIKLNSLNTNAFDFQIGSPGLNPQLLCHGRYLRIAWYFEI